MGEIADDDFAIFKASAKKPVKCTLCCGKEICVDYKQGITFCVDCGTHQSSTIVSLEPEWKGKEGDSLNRCNCVNDRLLPKMSMSTRLVGVPKYIGMIHSWHTLHSYKEHSLSKVFRKMEKTALDHNIPLAVVKYAEELYKLISSNNLKRGDSRIGVMGACIYYGCRARGIMKKEKDIAKDFNIDVKYICAGCDTIAEYIFRQGMDPEKVLSPFDIYDYVTEYCCLLELNDEFKERTMRVARVVNKRITQMKNMPCSLAAGCIYFVANLDDSIDMVDLRSTMKEKCEMSDTTIIKCFNSFKPFKDKMLKALNKDH